MKLDLHCHSVASDGKLTADELVTLAEAAELDYFSITDHDTTAAYKELKGRQFSFRLVTGIEISSQWSGVGIHIVGLNFNVDHVRITELIHHQRQVREKRARAIAQRLAANGMPGCLQGALAICHDIGQIGRPHFAQYMVSQGFVKSEKQAFDKWLGNGKLGDVKSHWPSIEEVVSAIVSAGGVAVLAHPLRYKMTFSKLRRLVSHFTEVGGQAIELVGHQVSPDKQKQLNKLAVDHQLAASAGSDFHDPQWRWAQVGQLPALPSDIVPIWQLFEHGEGV